VCTKYCHLHWLSSVYLSVQVLGAFAKFQKTIISFEMSLSLFVCLSVCPHDTTRLPLEGFSCNLIFQYFSKICQENSSFIKSEKQKRVLYMKTYVRLWQYLAKFFLEWEILQTKSVGKIKTHILWLITFSRKSCLLWDNVEEERDRPQKTIK
jgi:hypothetical protein